MRRFTVERSLTRRTLLKLSAAAAAGLSGLGILACSSEKSDVRFNFDPDTYLDPEKDRIPAESVIRKVKGFRGRRPNIIVILTDDMGYGDLGCYGSKAIKTLYIDQLAREGMRFTDFYAANSLCSPSRAGLLTGRYPHRTGVTWPVQSGKDTFMRKLMVSIGLRMGALGVLDLRGARSIAKGLPFSEITIAEALRVAGYRSACLGKWHLGDFVTDDRFLPRKHGFDYFIGFNGANDDFPVSFWRNETELVKDIGIDQARYTGLLTKEAIDFIERSKDKPFFLYFSHKDPHLPCFPSERFVDSSEGGRHGDTVQEVDWSVGEILSCLKRNGLDRNTIIIFTSDNGPWYDGSSGSLRGRKGQSFEGGYRVPMIAWFPGRIPAGVVCGEPSMGMDFFPTFLLIAGLELPSDRIIDGKNIWGLLSGKEKKTPHEALYFFHHDELEGVRTGKWKYFRYINTYTWPIPMDKPNHFIGIVSGGRDYKPEGSDISVPTMATWPVLYNMELDPGESYNVMKKYPGVVERMNRMLEEFEREFIDNPRGWIKR
jgi:arylsulfatase A